MRAVIQRVSCAEVFDLDDDLLRGKIDRGLVVLVGIGKDDEQKDIDYLVGKIPHLRIFPDEEGYMNYSVLDIHGEILLVPQFTLYGNCHQGRRPGFSDAAGPDEAGELFKMLAAEFKELEIGVQTGKFKAYMEVELINDGPVTLILDSSQTF